MPEILSVAVRRPNVVYLGLIIFFLVLNNSVDKYISRFRISQLICSNLVTCLNKILFIVSLLYTRFYVSFNHMHYFSAGMNIIDFPGNKTAYATTLNQWNDDVKLSLETIQKTLNALRIISWKVNLFAVTYALKHVLLSVQR